METDFLAGAAAKFFWRSDFALEFCFDDAMRRELTPAEIERLFPLGFYSREEQRAFADDHRDRPMARYFAYYGCIAAGQQVPHPCIWDGSTVLRVAEEGLYRAMLNRVADGLKQSRAEWPAIYPQSLSAPASKAVFGKRVVLHDTHRALAGVVDWPTVDAAFRIGRMPSP